MAKDSGCARNGFQRVIFDGGRERRKAKWNNWRHMNCKCCYGIIIRIAQRLYGKKSGAIEKKWPCHLAFCGNMHYVLFMDSAINYRGKTFNDDDISFIKGLIAENPESSRFALSKKLCREWNWVQPNGALKDVVCRGFMLQLHRAGQIQLPERKRPPLNPFGKRKKPEVVHIQQKPLLGPLKSIRPLTFSQVRRTPSEKLFNSLIHQYHYLNYCQPVGEHLKYIVYAQGDPIACMAWSSAPRHIKARDQFIGWIPDVRMKNLPLIAYNTRFLILPWVQLKNLASHILGQMARILPGDWQKQYNHPIYYLETFVDKSLFSGTCYKAANWIYLGDTTGRGKDDQTHKPNRTIKAIWGLPLTKHFRERLCHAQ